MQLLDATLAFALTMAALATVVTIIMETILRIARMRKKNLLRVLRLLNKELGEGPLGLSDEERWAFFTRVVTNPAEAAAQIATTRPAARSLEEGISCYGRDQKWQGLFENISLEHLLRCLAENDRVKAASRQAGATVTVEFTRLARKYEEFGSAVSAGFKHFAHFWSIAIGIGLAIGANIDGVRIFESYRTDPELAAAVIEKQPAFFESQRQAEDALKKFHAASEEVGELEDIRLKARQVQQQLIDLAAMGAPLGWGFYPNCPFGQGREAWATASLPCRPLAKADPEKKVDESWFGAPRRILKTARHDPGGFLIWLFTVTLTGILIGLGAPFWFDVAKRLAQLRKGLQQPTASAEFRLSGQEANGDPEKRREIVATVLADAAAEATDSPAAGTDSSLGPKALHL
ncbi:MAG: hypothetical protein JXB25_00310 [Deltaproteobacteria bacterium]|nr:hypothetical protein [Deltaproteobacteria bacterium]